MGNLEFGMAWGMGHGAWGIGAWGMGHGAFNIIEFFR